MKVSTKEIKIFKVDFIEKEISKVCDLEIDRLTESYVLEISRCVVKQELYFEILDLNGNKIFGSNDLNYLLVLFSEKLANEFNKKEIKNKSKIRFFASEEIAKEALEIEF